MYKILLPYRCPFLLKTTSHPPINLTPLPPRIISNAPHPPPQSRNAVPTRDIRYDRWIEPCVAYTQPSLAQESGQDKGAQSRRKSGNIDKAKAAEKKSARKSWKRNRGNVTVIATKKKDEAMVRAAYRPLLLYSWIHSLKKGYFSYPSSQTLPFQSRNKMARGISDPIKTERVINSDICLTWPPSQKGD